MNRLKQILYKIPLLPLTLITIFLALAPFQPEPHLWEKLKMLSVGELTKPIDIFDMFFHATPIAILLLKLAFGMHPPEQG